MNSMKFKVSPLAKHSEFETMDVSNSKRVFVGEHTSYITLTERVNAFVIIFSDYSDISRFFAKFSPPQIFSATNSKDHQTMDGKK